MLCPKLRLEIYRVKSISVRINWSVCHQWVKLKKEALNEKEKLDIKNWNKDSIVTKKM